VTVGLRTVLVETLIGTPPPETASKSDYLGQQ
jgi:hypothetical protein